MNRENARARLVNASIVTLIASSSRLNTSSSAPFMVILVSTVSINLQGAFFNSSYTSAVPILHRCERPFLTGYCVGWKEQREFSRLTSCATVLQTYLRMCGSNSIFWFTVARADWAYDVGDGAGSSRTTAWKASFNEGIGSSSLSPMCLGPL